MYMSFLPCMTGSLTIVVFLLHFYFSACYLRLSHLLIQQFDFPLTLLLVSLINMVSSKTFFFLLISVQVIIIFYVARNYHVMTGSLGSNV